MANKKYDCLLDINKSLIDNINLVLKLIKNEIYDIYDTSYTLLVYEKYTNNVLPLDKNLTDLKLYDGITLIIY